MDPAIVAKSRTQRYVVVVFDGVSLGIMSFAFGVFDLARHYGALPDIDIKVVSGEDTNAALTGGGLACPVPYDLDAIRAADLVIIPNWRDPAEPPPPPLMEAIDQADPVGETLTWALGRLDQVLPVETLARRAQMSRRTFDRRFREITGTAPLTWLTHQRCCAPSNCWSPPGCRWRRWPAAAASPRPPRCARTSAGSPGPRPPPTAAPSANQPQPSPEIAADWPDHPCPPAAPVAMIKETSSAETGVSP